MKNPSWEELVVHLNKWIEADRDALCKLSTPPDRTLELRARIAAYREILGLPELEMKKARILGESDGRY